MDLTWNLDNIYTSFDSQEFKGDMKQLKNYIATINRWAINNFQDNNNPSHKIEEFLRLNNEYKSLYSCLYSYSYLIMSMDFEDQEAVCILDNLENENLGFTGVFVRFSRWISNIRNLDEIIDASAYISEHKFYLKELLAKAKYLLSEKEEVVTSKMQNTGSKAWEKLYMELIASTTIDITINNSEEKLTLAELTSMAYEKNGYLRKTAYYKEKDLCKSISQVCAKCLNGISGEALTIYEMRGYKSTLEKVLIDSRMDFKTLNALISAIKESLPMFHRYYLKKAKILGYESKLPFYDIYAPIGDNNMKLCYDDAKNLIISSFETFSESLCSFAKKAFENKWIDAEPRKGKGNYGISVDIFPIKESRISTNFNGNHIDVSILAHEIGHGYHSSTLFDEKILNTEYPIPIAETASIFCETLVNNKLLSILPQDETLTILERSISDAAYYIVDFYGRYLFETQLFERRKSGPLSLEEINELMLSSMKASYGDSIDPETIHPYMWMNKIGYFITGNEFLNFPYSFGVLFAKGLYAEYIKKGHTFAKEYEEFLSCTSKNSIVDVAKIMDIDINSVDFWRGSLKLIEEDIEKITK